MGPYNGYSGKERNAKLKARHERTRQGIIPHPPGPCAICRDPSVSVQPHAEDYSIPFLWEPPAEYALCNTCHKNKLHKRFSNPDDWKAWKAHVRRGGYSTDLHDPAVMRELQAYKAALRNGETLQLRSLRERPSSSSEWWDGLSLDRASLTDISARPRP